MTWALLTPPSSPSHPLRQRAWTHYTGEYWRRLITLWRMVSLPSEDSEGPFSMCGNNTPSASIPLDKCFGSDTSVYTGCFTNDYLSILQQDFEAEQRHAAMGVAPSMLANRLSWFFNFKGTSMNLDSACSSSLVALHLASQDLRAGTTPMVRINHVFLSVIN